jgi:hypothetical protein
MPTSSSGWTISPPLSQTTARAGRRDKILAEPTRWRQAIHESDQPTRSRCGSLVTNCEQAP